MSKKILLVINGDSTIVQQRAEANINETSKLPLLTFCEGNPQTNSFSGVS